MLFVIGDGPARAGARGAGRGARHRVARGLHRHRAARARSRPTCRRSTSRCSRPSSSYASPLKLFEYLALGRAIVAPDQPNIREVLDDGVNALLFDPDDPRRADRRDREAEQRRGAARRASRPARADDRARGPDVGAQRGARHARCSTNCCVATASAYAPLPAARPVETARRRTGRCATPRPNAEVRVMKLLTFTSLYPNARAAGSRRVRREPARASGRRRDGRRRSSSRRCRGSRSTPSALRPFRRRSRACPDARRGTASHVLHPRYVTVPALGALFAPLAMALGARATIARLIADGSDFDAIDAHYFFPTASPRRCSRRWFRLPLVITARGSDINQIARLPVARARDRAGRAASRVGDHGCLHGVEERRRHRARRRSGRRSRCCATAST